MFETIVALASAPIKSALAIIRLSGEDCFEITSKCFSKDIDKDKKGILIGCIKDGDKTIDQVVVNVYVAPNSFTGENSLEIMCHGSLLIAKDIISLLIKNGAREAKRGEFSERAFLNRKIDLVQAEAINDLINATTEKGKDLVLLSLEGKASEQLKPLIDEVGYLLSLIEVNIDYPEYEDLEEVNEDIIINKINDIIPKIDDLLSSANKGYIFVNGIKVALIGKPNVGKSSLLNALLKKDKAIVTDIPGTTRDIVEGDTNIDGIPLHIIDTAGIRESKDKIESLGIDKSKDQIKEADLVLLILDSTNIDDEDLKLMELVKDKKHIIIYNKSDLKNMKEKGIAISAKNNDLSQLINEIKKVFGVLDFSFDRPALTSAREIGLLKQTKEHFLNAKDVANKHIGIDLVSSSLMSGFKCLKTITGEENSIDISKEIFSRFCVGK